MPTLDDKLQDEYRDVFRGAKKQSPKIEPTEDEKRNGWSAEALTEYVAEQMTAQTIRNDPHSLQRRIARRPTHQNDSYSPLRWRR